MCGCNQIFMWSQNGGLEEHGYMTTSPAICTPFCQRQDTDGPTFLTFTPNRSILSILSMPSSQRPSEHTCIWTNMFISHGKYTPWGTMACLRKRVLERTHYRTWVWGGSQDAGAYSGLGATWNQGQFSDRLFQWLFPKGRMAKLKL